MTVNDFTEVTLRHDVDVQGVRMPAGAHGVVMATYADGKAYEVEFEQPQHVVLTLEGRALVSTDLTGMAGGHCGLGTVAGRE